MNRPSPGRLAQVACLLELTAKKPGNVHRSADFDDAHFLDFALSASAIGPAMDLATGIGPKVLASVESTRNVVNTNTNLGMILLLAPLVSVVAENTDDDDLRSGVVRVVDSSTIEDARLVYRAIRLAEPGGMGRVDDQDIEGEPTIRLVEAMRLAADRDLIARQYANGFAEVFEVAFPALQSAIERGESIETAIILAQLNLMARHPDTLIVRKRGWAIAEEASRRALALLAMGWPDGAESRQNFADLDRWLRADGHARNPGASADLVTAAIFVALQQGSIEIPFQSARWSTEKTR